MNKKVIILILAIVIILAILLVVFLSQKNNTSQLTTTEKLNETPFKIEFLDDAEKANLNVSPETKIQVLQRGPNGEPLVYKVINNQDDIISDLSGVEVIRPENSQE